MSALRLTSEESEIAFGVPSVMIDWYVESIVFVQVFSSSSVNLSLDSSGASGMYYVSAISCASLT